MPSPTRQGVVCYERALEHRIFTFRYFHISLLQSIATHRRDTRRQDDAVFIKPTCPTGQPYSVIGNTPDFDSVFPGSSPGRATFFSSCLPCKTFMGAAQRQLASKVIPHLEKQGPKKSAYFFQINLGFLCRRHRFPSVSPASMGSFHLTLFFMAQIDLYFDTMLENDASDLHLSSGNPPIIRIHGELERLDAPPLEHESLKEMLREICPDDKMKHYDETGDVDFGYELPGKARFRANFFTQKDGIGAVFRTIPSKVLTTEQLGLPEICQKFAKLTKGMVLVTGPTGSGKSTTLAAIIDYANKVRSEHILTIEDPIEFVHQSVKALINHREVGLHTKSFASALRGALREDPDIILVGEMRDLETIALALEAAATGHLVFGTLHTPSAAKTIDRIIDVFPAGQQNQIRTTLSESIKGVIAQNLFKRVDKPGRVAALEVLVVDTPISNLIREEKTFQIPGMLEVGRKKGNVPLDAAIMEHLEAGRISPDEAFEKCLDKKRFLPFLTREPEAWEL